MIVLDRLHRGDIPRYVAVTAYQSDARLVFKTQFDADLFIKVHQRADSCVSFRCFEVPEIGLHAFWEACRDFDWHYENSDDHGEWREGGARHSTLQAQSTISREHRRCYLDWRRHFNTGPAYGNERYPAPEEPARDTDGSPQGPDRNGLDGEAATARAEGIAQPPSLLIDREGEGK